MFLLVWVFYFILIFFKIEIDPDFSVLIQNEWDEIFVDSACNPRLSSSSNDIHSFPHIFPHSINFFDTVPGMIAGVVVGAIAGVTIIGAAALYLVRCKQKRETFKKLSTTNSVKMQKL